MAREEQIKNAAWDYFQDLDSHHFHLLPHCNPQTDAFEAGAKWADKTMIDKACEWLKENIDLYSYNAFNTKSGYTEITLTDEFETAFRQAMKGE